MLRPYERICISPVQGFFGHGMLRPYSVGEFSAGDPT